MIIVTFNIICFGEKVYLEIFKARLDHKSLIQQNTKSYFFSFIKKSYFFSFSSFTDKAKSFTTTNLFICSIFVAMDLIFFFSLVVNVYCCSTKVFTQEIFKRIQWVKIEFTSGWNNFIFRFLVKYTFTYLPLQIASWVLLLFSFEEGHKKDVSQLRHCSMIISSCMT